MSMENVPSSAEAERRKLGGGAIATLGGVAALAIFMLQNTDDVTVEFLFWDFTMAGVAADARVGTRRCAGLVRTGCAAPSPPARGAPRRPSELSAPAVHQPLVAGGESDLAQWEARVKA